MRNQHVLAQGHHFIKTRESLVEYLIDEMIWLVYLIYEVQ